jgi:hypothetical protein
MSKKIKITPGPWYLTVHETGNRVQSARLNEDNYVCNVEGRTRLESVNNARLIAAAPELAEILEELLKDFRKNSFDNPEYYDSVKAADRILAKIRGQSED